IVVIDIASMFILLVGMIIVTFSTRSNESKFNKKNILISNYTIRIKGIVFSFENIYSELNSLIRHLNSIMAVENPNDIKKLFLLKGKSMFYKNHFNDCYDKISKEYINNTTIYDINYPIVTDRKLNLILKYQTLNVKRMKLQKF